jgi:lysophospholipase L1-like esterase
MRRILVAVTAAALLACLAPLSAVAATRPANNGREYYLALGDSLAQGAQPNASGVTVPTDQGYANDLYAQEQSRFKHLRLVDLGCLGETTTTMISGGICSYPKGSQLSQAVAFLHAHKGKVAFVTIDIGANDVDGCVTGTTVNSVCLGQGVMDIEKNLPMIAAALRKAAAPNVPIIGMTYYDPFLAAWFEGPSGQTLAAVSQALARALINKDIANAYRSANVEVANVAGAFQTYVPLSKTTTFHGQQVPLAVVQICNLTWMCAPPPQGPNVHANAAGYSKIAEAFAKLL